MRFQEIKEGLSQRKATLIERVFLLVLAAALTVLVIRFDTVMGWLRLAGDALAPVVCGLVMAFVLNVFVHLFEGFVFRPFDKVQNKVWQKVRYPLAVVLAYLVVLVVLLFLFGFIVPGIVESLTVLAETLQRTLPATVGIVVQRATRFANEHDLDFLVDLIRQFNWSSALSRLTEVTTNLLGTVLSVTSLLASGLVTAIMGFFFSVYMLFGKEKLLRGVKDALKAFLPPESAKKWRRVGSMTYQVFYSFVRGQLTECVILGALCYIGMRLLGLDYSLLISSIVALTALIPVLGAYIGCGAGVLILLFIKPINALVFLIFLIVLQQVEGNFIYPRVVGSSIGLPPVWTLFAVLFWGGVLGIPGILLGTPATAVVYRLFRAAVRERLEQRDAAPATRDLSEPQSLANGPRSEQESEQV